MTTTDWLIDVALVLMVLRQVREGRIDLRFIVIPFTLCAYTLHAYVHSLPSAGNDLVLIAAATAVGMTLGILGGFTTHVRAEKGRAFARAGIVAAGLWVVSMSARLGFIIWITHSSGEQALERFSVSHDVIGAAVWQTALVLLALSEVLVRLGIVVSRGYLKARPARTSSRRELVNA